MPFRVDMPTFAGGEIGPDLASRFDTAKYKTALRKSRNMLSLVGGGVYMRPGLKFCGETDNSALPSRQIPFQFSLTQGYSLVFGDYNMRVMFSGGYVLDNDLIVTGISNAPNAVITALAHGWVAGDSVYFTGQLGMVEINNLLGKVLQVNDADHAVVDIDTTGFGVWTGSTGGVAGNALGGTGGHAPPPPPPGPGVPIPPIPPFGDFAIPPGGIFRGRGVPP